MFPCYTRRDLLWNFDLCGRLVRAIAWPSAQYWIEREYIRGSGYYNEANRET